MKLRPKIKISKNNKGQSTLEFVMTIPLIIILVLAATQTGLAVYSRMQVQQAAREAARIVSTTNRNDIAIKTAETICGTDTRVNIEPGDPQQRKLGDMVTINVSRRPEGLFKALRWVIRREVILNAVTSMRMECGHGDF
jgi:Flp pilus assembly protein TadG